LLWVTTRQASNAQLLEMCRSTRDELARGLPIGWEILYGPGLAGSDEPPVRELRTRGAHFYWVGIAPAGSRYWDSHIGVVFDQAALSARAGLHAARPSQIAMSLLNALEDELAAAGLERTESEAADEVQWNWPPRQIHRDDAIAGVCQEALQLAAWVSRRSAPRSGGGGT
jgi:hypothetical protein